MLNSSWYKTLALSFVVTWALILSGCTSAPRIHSIYEQGVDFNEYETFSFLQSLEPQGEEYLTLSDRYLRDAIRAELQARGFREAEDSDLLVGYNVSTKEKLSATSYPSTSIGYYGYRGRYGYTYGLGYGTETRVNQYTEGTLNIDVVDRAQKQLIWEGVAVGRLDDTPSKNLKAEVYEVVSAVFEEFPVAEKSAQSSK